MAGEGEKIDVPAAPAESVVPPDPKLGEGTAAAPASKPGEGTATPPDPTERINQGDKFAKEMPKPPEKLPEKYKELEETAKKTVEQNRLPDNYSSMPKEEQNKIMEDKNKHPELYQAFEKVSGAFAALLPAATNLSPEEMKNFPDNFADKIMKDIPEDYKKFFNMLAKLFLNDDEEETEDSLKQYGFFNSAEYKNKITSKSEIVKQALNICGSQEFRSPTVGYGRLACAQVATEILVRAGYLNQQVFTVSGAVDELKSKGWKEHGPSEKPEAGWVIVWNRSGSNMGNGQVVAGHGHIGVMISEKECVSNSSNQKTPRIHGANYSRRGIAMYLSPPSKA